MLWKVNLYSIVLLKFSFTSIQPAMKIYPAAYNEPHFSTYISFAFVKKSSVAVNVSKVHFN